MAKEAKAIGQRVMVCHPISQGAMVWPPLAKAIGKATGTRNWPIDGGLREAEISLSLFSLYRLSFQSSLRNPQSTKKKFTKISED
jgi:hypothetical protein